MNTLRKMKSTGFSTFFVAALMGAVSIEGAHAQSTDAFLTNYIIALNARMSPSGDPATVAELFTEDGAHY
jgi:hypothetical protein